MNYWEQLKSSYKGQLLIRMHIPGKMGRKMFVWRTVPELSYKTNGEIEAGAYIENERRHIKLDI